VFYVGKTRSGKSFLARHLLKVARARKWRIVIVDPKRDWTRTYSTGSKEKGTVDAPVLVTQFDPSLAVQIYQPVEWNGGVAKFCTDIMQTGNTIVYWDEITQLVRGVNVPIEFAVLWSQGASRGIGAWAGTQRPRNVPILIKDQSETWFVFRLPNLSDRKVVGEYIPVDDTPELVEKALPYRYFWYYNDSMERPVLVKPIDIGGNNGQRDRVQGGQYIA
jgi:hypothetical protein